MTARFRIDTSILVRIATGDCEDGFELCVPKLPALVRRPQGHCDAIRHAALNEQSYS